MTVKAHQNQIRGTKDDTAQKGKGLTKTKCIRR